MFDIYELRSGPSHVYHYTDVHEHRAPTDESVKLLNEMQRKAEQNIIANLSTSNNTLQVSATRFFAPMEMRDEWAVKMTLNGKPHQFKVSLPYHAGTSSEDAIQALHKALAEEIAQKVLMGFSQELTGAYRLL